MRLFRLGAATLVATGALFGCGGGDNTPAPAAITYTKLVSFGDSLSDVGTYATPGVRAATGGGKYTVNGAGAQIWVEKLATAVNVAVPCAAQTGLKSIGPLAGFAAPVTNHAGCFGYAQGGARVTNPVGPGNLATFPASSSGALGQLTVPVLQQISNHLVAAGGSFTGTDLVTVFAGPNDLFMQIAALQATVAAGGNATAAGTAAVTAMGQAGGELAAYVKNLIVAKGAKRVVVVGMPDASLTPDALTRDQATRDLIQMMSFTFNSNLQFGLQGLEEVLYVDGYKAIQDWHADPAKFGLSNVTAGACNAALVATSLFCTAATTITGDTSKYLFADGTGHATPFGYGLFADTVVQAMTAKGWL